MAFSSTKQEKIGEKRQKNFSPLNLAIILSENYLKTVCSPVAGLELHWQSRENPNIHTK